MAGGGRILAVNVLLLSLVSRDSTCQCCGVLQEPMSSFIITLNAATPPPKAVVYRDTNLPRVGRLLHLQVFMPPVKPVLTYNCKLNW